ILELGSIGKTFDIIESVGVLHHLAEPLAGWRVLLNLLRPGGLMRLGFYSEMARTNVVEARNYIHSKGYTATGSDIRQCRQDLMSNQIAFSEVLSFRDFYGMSECRDLLFHVQEHRFTIPALKDAMDGLGLTFLGFTLEAEILDQYLKQFAADPSATNLDNWHVFETENPKVFSGMYQFWAQKI
ncbi:MAG: class I SAM-dependent methyltransferase, partial [Rhodoferax sp.]